MSRSPKRPAPWSSPLTLHSDENAWNRTTAFDQPLRPVISKSRRKREAHVLQDLGTQLVALSPAHLAKLELPEALREAVLTVRGMHQHGARLRQMQYIGRLMRQLDEDELYLVQQALHA